MSQIFDCLCIGNAKIDVFLSIHQATSYLRVNKETNELCVKFGEKIPVDKCFFLPGGNACNVSVGLSKLGIKSSLVAEIGSDEFSEKIINSLSLENVNTDFVIKTQNASSSFSVILDFKTERTIFTQHVQREHKFSFANISTKWIYLTSLGNRWEEAYTKAVAFVRQKNIKLAFNPGTLQLEKGQKAINDVLEITDILFVNKEEAERIYNLPFGLASGGQFTMNNETESKRNINQLLRILQKLGPKIIVITDGENGSFAIDEKGEIFIQAIYKTNVVEKTGAGDAYASGFLAAFILGKGIPTAMQWGAKNSSSVITQYGAQNGLLQQKEIEKQ